MKSILSIITLSLALVFASVTAQAEESGAKVVSVKGGAAIVDAAGARTAITMGQQLASGQRIVTKSGGGVTLLLDDGSQLSIGANTDMTLTELSKSDDDHITLFSVFQGLIKATVNKLTIGSKFELISDHGVAAVKGTEYEATVDKKKGMEVRVKEGKVWLHDTKREKKIIIDAKRKGSVNAGRLGTVRKMQKRELRRFGEWARANLPRDTEKEARFERFWNSLKPGQKHRFVDAAKESLGDTWSDIVNLREEERSAKWKQRLRRADDLKLAAEESRVDFTLGNVLIDRHGRRVRMDEFILRPDKKTIQFLNYTKREGRTDVINAAHTYNKDLPYRLGDPALRLGKKEWKHTAPEYWVVNGTVIFGNDQGDSLAMSESFYDPVQAHFLTIPVAIWVLPVKDFELRMNIDSLRLPNRLIGETLASRNGVLLERYERSDPLGGSFGTTAANGTTPVLDTGTDLDKWQKAVRSNLNLTGGLAFTSGGVIHENLGPVALGGVPGDFAGGFRRTYGDGTFIELGSRLIDEHGDIRNVQALLASTNGDLFEAMIQVAFFSFAEVEISSNKFAGPGIDVVSKMLWWSHISKNRDDL